MNVERDQFLIEEMGECWHVINGTVNNVGLCVKCGERLPYCYSAESYYRNSPRKVIDFYSQLNTDFSTWEGFGKLWSWGENQDWWGDFIYHHNQTVEPGGTAELWLENLVNPDKFANAICDYLRFK